MVTPRKLKQEKNQAEVQFYTMSQPEVEEGV